MAYLRLRSDAEYTESNYCFKVHSIVIVSKTKYLLDPPKIGLTS